MTTSSRTPPVPIGFAHRGARAERRENTLEAFGRALELGATGLETDAWLTADGEVVLDHDGVTGPPFFRRAISGTQRGSLPRHIPTLAELYQHCGTDFELSIDVKDPAALESLLRAAREAGAADRLWLCSADWRATGSCSTAPEVHLVESSDLARMKEGLAARASALAADGVDALNLHRSQWTRDRVREVRACGLFAFAWDAQTEGEIRRLLACGVDGVYSDHVGAMMAAISDPPRVGGDPGGRSPDR